MRKKISIWLVIMMLVTLCPCTVYAGNNAVPSKTVSSIDAAASFMRSQMVKRNETFIIYYKKKITSASAMNSVANKIKAKSLEHTGKPEEGDYLLWQFGSYRGSYTYGGSTTTLRFTMKYYTTAKQEKEVGQAVDKALTSLHLENDSKYEKFRKIYNYIRSNVTYDYSGLKDLSNSYCHTAHAAIIRKTCVCQGYALLLYRMALEEGIDNRIIGRFKDNEGHAWNIVKLGRKYYQADVTWDSLKGTDKYFLRGTKTFPDHEEYSRVYKENEDIISNYSLSDIDYAEAAAMKPKSTGIRKLAALDDGFKVTVDEQLQNTTGYEIRYSLNSGMSKSKTKKITNNQTTVKKITGLKSKKKYYVQVRTYNTYHCSAWSSKKSVTTR